jgi:hypothetical protein
MTLTEELQASFDHANAISDAPCTCDSARAEYCGACRAADDAWGLYYDLLDATDIGAWPQIVAERELS